LGVVTADAPALVEHLKCVANLVTFGVSDGADLRLTQVRHLADPGPASGGDDAGHALEFSINNRTQCRLSLVGEHNALNAMAAFAVGKRLGIDEKKIVEALAGAKGPGMRLERTHVRAINGAPGQPLVAIINDAYNANPDSMLAAIKTFLAITPPPAPGRRRVLVLGDMLELGESSEACHREVGEYLAKAGGFDMAVLVGHLSLHIADRLHHAGFPAEKVILRSDLEGTHARAIAQLLRSGDSVLLKGSRRMRLERIIEALSQADNERGMHGGAAPHPTAPAAAAPA
jgi:UDP-N-acetylmuramoyl-tripeptide--D-alanyl-D-alanine ligase